MRINVVPVYLLSDSHLRAEYREILMAPHYYYKSANSAKGIIRSNISKTYTLNKGHAYFWYDKMGYIYLRCDELELEMMRRGFKIRDTYDLKVNEFVLNQDINGYKVTQTDITVNVQRILQRIYEMEFVKGKPNYYKLYRENKSFDEWLGFYNSALKLSFKIEDFR